MNHLVDLDTYPIDRRDSAEYRALVDACRADLAADGMFELPGFLREEPTRQSAKAAAPAMRSSSFRHARLHNVYFRDEVEGLDADHPALAKVETVNHTLGADQLSGNPIVDLYDWTPFADFLADVMNKDRLYCMDDAIARVNIQATRAGEALNWHFDRSEFTTTILLQAAEEGGALEYRKDLRDANRPNHDGIVKVLEGKDPDVGQVKLKEGALNVFRGVNTMHRVTTVRGETERMVAIFSFYDRPGVKMTPKEQIGFYGHAAP